MGLSMDDWRKALERHLSVLGRDDIGIGHVSATDSGHLEIEFIKGDMRRKASLAVEDLQHPDRARAALNTALLRMSKAIEQEHIQEAKQK